jgi:hypothetical protein
MTTIWPIKRLAHSFWWGAVAGASISVAYFIDLLLRSLRHLFLTRTPKTNRVYIIHRVSALQQSNIHPFLCKLSERVEVLGFLGQCKSF